MTGPDNTIRTILVTGGSGFVGNRFAKRWNDHFRLLLPSHSELDITNEESVSTYLSKYRPDAVFHLAAISNTGYCEEHPEESFQVNVRGAQLMARHSERAGARFVFFSSDQVYNGTLCEGLLSEDVSLAPENHYGRHKLEAERLVAEEHSAAISLRATWMYDVPSYQLTEHADFRSNLLRAISQCKTLAFATREFRGITPIDEIVEHLPKTFSLPAGVYNYGAENEINTYETALRCCEHLSDDSTARALIIADENRFANHVRNISVSTKKIKEASRQSIQFRSTLEAFKQY